MNERARSQGPRPLVSEEDISRINLALMTANGLMGLVFEGLAIVDMWVITPRTLE